MLYLLTAAVFFYSAASAQAKCELYSATAIYSMKMPGNIPVDENGRKRKIPFVKQHEIYLRTSCSIKPVVTSLKYKNTTLHASAEKITPEEYGNVERNFHFNANSKKTYYYWKISADENIEEDRPSTPIMLKVKIGSRSFVKRITEEEETVTVLAQ